MKAGGSGATGTQAIACAQGRGRIPSPPLQGDCLAYLMELARCSPMHFADALGRVAPNKAVCEALFAGCLTGYLQAIAESPQARIWVESAAALIATGYRPSVPTDCTSRPICCRAVDFIQRAGATVAPLPSCRASLFGRRYGAGAPSDRLLRCPHRLTARLGGRVPVGR